MQHAMWFHAKTLALTGAILCASVSAHAWTLRQTELGAPLHWADPDVTFIGVCEDECTLPGVGYKAALRGGVEAWSHTECEAVRATYGSVQNLRPGFVVGGPNQNVIWHGRDAATPDPSVLAVTLWTYDRNTGEIADADIVINADVPWTDRAVDGRYDLQSAVAHEVGHAFGLDHTDAGHAAVMTATMSDDTPLRRTPTRDDVEGLEAIYGHAGSPTERAEYDADQAEEPEEYVTLFECSQAGAARPPVFFALALVIGFALVRRGRGAAAIVGCAAVLVPSLVSATTVLELDVDDLVALSAAVVRGEVVQTDTHWDDGRIVTDATIAVDECYAGTCPELVSVRTLGGELDDWVMEVSGTPHLEPGLGLVLFLSDSDAEQAPMTVTSLAQGCFFVTGAPGAEIAIRDLSGLLLSSPVGVRRTGVVEWGFLADLEAALVQDSARFVGHSVDGTEIRRSSHE